MNNNKMNSYSFHFYFRNITSTYLNASGLINGVNVSSLHQQAFNKSKENYLKKKLIFYENVQVMKRKSCIVKFAKNFFDILYYLAISKISHM